MWDCHGPDFTEEVVGVFEVGGVFGGNGVEVCVNVNGYVVCGTVAIRNYGSTRRNCKGNGPGFWGLVNFREEIELAWAGVVWTREEIFLFVGDVALVVKGGEMVTDLGLC